MRPDLRDLQYAYHPAMGEDPESDTMRIFVAIAVTNGSRERSPFLHASKSIVKSRKFAKLGINLRGETGNLFCRIRIYDMLWDGILRPGDVIDVSNIAAVKEFFNKKPGDYGEWFENNFQQCVQFATSAQEVLIKWRGRFPLKYFSVVDDVTDEDYGPLDDWVPAHHLPAIQPMPPIIFGHTKLFEVLICWLFFPISKSSFFFKKKK